MLTMLVVDDEIYALKGITEGIDWSDLPISTILEADHVESAKQHILANRIDLVVSDIEMPGANGLELLRFIREVSPHTLTVFLTGHARFEYAKEALHLGCFDYLLKPIDHDALKEIVVRAIGEIEERRKQQMFEVTLDEYNRQWMTQLPLLVERFWQEVLTDRASLQPARLDRELKLYNIPLQPDDRVLPVLLSIEQWNVSMDARDESIMEYAVRKAAAEIVLADHAGAVLQDRSDLNLVLLYIPKGNDGGREQLLAKCQQYVKACHDYFHCRLSCYVGEPVEINQLSSAMNKLQHMERTNVTRSQAVLDSRVSEEEESPVTGSSLPSFIEWSQMLDNGRIDELLKSLEHSMMRFQEETARRETLELYYFGFVHMLYHVANKRGMSIYDSLSIAEINEGLSLRSIQQLHGWSTKLLQKFNVDPGDRQKDTSAIIAKIQAYIQDNLHKEMNRDDIANAVYRNPAYLSRLFRKETGLSLSDYITQVKMERVKKLLTETNDKISIIAEEVGYVHFSYFAKLFKKMTGLTPQDYRKMNQVV